MPYIQNTETDQKEMLEAIGVDKLEALFSTIPDSIRFAGSFDLPESLSELELKDHIAELGAKNSPADLHPFFLGAGSYHHFIPEVVNHLAGRSEFVTAYTPYQPELSQGALQAFFEYQTLICMLTGLDISNASMYDGASALAEGALMAIDGTGRRKVLLSDTVHPEYREVLKTYLRHLDVEIIPIAGENGVTSLTEMDKNLSEEVAAVLVQSPNFFGAVEDLGATAEMAKKAGAVSIASVDPISLSVLKSPGELGVDIATGEGQGLGTPMSFGGPGFGFLACRMDRVRRLPGRVVGQTTDRNGKAAYVLTFQTREQHIRRERATSNICTNHALVAMRAAIYLSSLGRTGFARLGEIIVSKAHETAKKIAALDGFEMALDAPFFKEFVIRCPKPVVEINEALRKNDIIGGYDLSRDYPEMKNLMLVCVTEMTSDSDVERLLEVLKKI